MQRSNTTTQPSRSFSKDTASVLSAASDITTDGKRFIIQSLDPFHDENYPLVGLPDEYQGDSLLYRIEKSFVVQKPPQLASGANYDAHVSFIPCVVSQTRAVGMALGLAGLKESETSFSGLNIEDTAQRVAIGGLTCSTSPSTIGFTFDADGYIANQTEYRNIDLSSFGNDGKFRIISGAFEVVNTTPDLYKSGSVTVYRQDNDWTPCDMTPCTGAFQPLEGNVLAQVCIGPPLSLAQAKQLNSLTWAAEEGCLVPLVMKPYAPQTFLRQVPIVPSLDHSSAIGATSVFSLSSTPTTGVPMGTVPFQASHLISCMNSGAYFSGLSEQSTLLVTGRFVIEKFPNPTSDLVPLAMPSPSYDPRALELIVRALHDLPVGVRVDENAAGDWFRRALGAMRSIVNSRPFRAAVSAASQAPGNMGLMATAVDAALALEDARRAKAKASRQSTVVKPTKGSAGKKRS